MVKLIRILLLLISLVYAKSSSKQRADKSREKANTAHYQNLVEKAKQSKNCIGLESDDFLYSCATYTIHPECFLSSIGQKGLEFGEDDKLKHQKYY